MTGFLGWRITSSLGEPSRDGNRVGEGKGGVAYQAAVSTSLPPAFNSRHNLCRKRRIGMKKIPSMPSTDKCHDFADFEDEYWGEKANEAAKDGSIGQAESEALIQRLLNHGSL
jgi:hypothetical protein